MWNIIRCKSELGRTLRRYLQFLTISMGCASIFQFFFSFFHFPVQSNCIILEITCFLDSLFKESIVVLISSWHTLKECRTFSVAPETIILRLDFNCPVCDDWTRRKTSLYRFEKPPSFYCIFKVSQLLYLLPVFIE